MKKLSDIIEVLQYEHGLSQEKLAKAIKIDVKTKKAIFSKANLSTKTLTAILNYLRESSIVDSEFDLKAIRFSHYLDLHPMYLPLEEKLEELKALGTDFNIKQPHPWCAQNIQADVCGELSDFIDAFTEASSCVKNKAQKEVLKEVLLLSAMFMIESDKQALISETGCIISLKELGHAWIYRLFVNANMTSPRIVPLDTINSGMPNADVRAQQFGHVSSPKPMIIFYELLEGLDAVVSPGSRIIPENINVTSAEGRRIIFDCCKLLNDRIGVLRNSKHSFLLYCDECYPTEIAELITRHLPKLRCIQVEMENGESYLKVDGGRLKAFLDEGLLILEQIDMSKTTEEPNTRSGDTFNNYGSGNQYSKSTHNGQNLHIEQIELCVGELKPLLQGLIPAIVPSHREDSEEVNIIKQVLETPKPQKPMLDKLNEVLEKLVKATKAGSKISELATQAAPIAEKLGGLLT